MKVVTFPGKVIKCLKCKKNIKYTWTSGMSDIKTFFYSIYDNNVLRSKKIDDELGKLLLSKTTNIFLEEAANNLLSSFENGKYTLWSNVRCPYCAFEFPYDFRGNIRLRLSDEKAILLDGSKVMGDSDKDSFIVKVEV